MKILIIGALPRSLINFREPLLKAMLREGHTIFAAANGRDSHTETKLKELGVEYCSIRIERTGINPWADFITLLEIIRLIKRIKPDKGLHYTIKPIVYGGLAAKFCGIASFYSMVEGLGRAFMPIESFGHWVASIFAKGLYRIGLVGSDRVFFLNSDDMRQFVSAGYVSASKAVLLNGIGIDLDFYPQKNLVRHSYVCFLMIARLLKDKGVREYVEAARMVRKNYPHAEFLLAGDLDENPSSVKREELDSWQNENIIRYVGYVEDVRSLYEDCDVYVLPSYREGTPRTVLEAMSTGRAVITTDVPGCRETVTGFRRTKEETTDFEVGCNGILVPVKNARKLAAAMEFFLEKPEQIAAMGKESRFYAEKRYDVHNVNAVILREMGLKK